jgi:hypothetical protein
VARWNNGSGSHHVQFGSRSETVGMLTSCHYAESA